MTQRFSIFYVTLLLVIYSDMTAAQQPKRPDGVRLISVGEITKVNSRKRSIELKSEPVEPRSESGTSAENVGRGAGWHGSVWIGASRGQRGGTLDSRGEPSDLPIPPSPRDDPRARTVTTHVLTTGETVFSNGGKPIPFEELRVGDRVQVTGVIRGKDVEAKEIVRRGSATDR